ncbi:hypothetical protein [Paraburkholderia phenoliruptrix]|uniref:hypothetical protein n=1 Tax=Paraburkholderia phenoliruptrix TaxID=252970 RepID=UPI00286997B8|nr:hypothetical protein [Paraburkholderia phenoliruptrix]WMY09588.1 hypothetical protein P3F88_07430 [Paraburkholderia phenoliruptrix]
MNIEQLASRDAGMLSSLSTNTRTLLNEALDSLLRERISALRIASAAAIARMQPVPTVVDYGIADVLGLQRLLDETTHRNDQLGISPDRVAVRRVAERASSD